MYPSRHPVLWPPQLWGASRRGLLIAFVPGLPFNCRPVEIPICIHLCQFGPQVWLGQFSSQRLGLLLGMQPRQFTCRWSMWQLLAPRLRHASRWMTPPGAAGEVLAAARRSASHRAVEDRVFEWSRRVFGLVLEPTFCKPGDCQSLGGLLRCKQFVSWPRSVGQGVNQSFLEANAESGCCV